MTENTIGKHQKNGTHGSLRSYIIGFVLSILLTLAAYFPIVMHQNSMHKLFTHELLIGLIFFFALLQLLVQLLFFLHLRQESKPRWKLVIFLSTIGLVLIVVIGSLWIMAHLNYNMTPKHMEDYILQDEGIHTK